MDKKNYKKIALIVTASLAFFGLAGASMVKISQEPDNQNKKVDSKESKNPNKKVRFDPYITSGVVAPEDVKKRPKIKKEAKPKGEIMPLSGEVAPASNDEKNNKSKEQLRPSSGAVAPNKKDKKTDLKPLSGGVSLEPDNKNK